MSNEHEALPDGMVPWAGGHSAPEDWDFEKPVLLRDGRTLCQREQRPELEWMHRGGKWAFGDIIAYTPKRATPSPSTDTLPDPVETSMFDRCPAPEAPMTDTLERREAMWLPGIGLIELTEDGYSLRTPYDGDVNGDTGQHIVVGGEVLGTFTDSDEGEALREFVLAALTTSPRVDEGRAREVLTLPRLSDEMMRAAAIAWIDNNFGALSGKSNATERLIACFVGGLGASWDSVAKAFEDEWSERLSALATTPADPRVGKMEADLEVAKKALAFYADPDSDGYSATATDYGLSMEVGDIIKDGGELARSTLSQIEDRI